MRFALGCPGLMLLVLGACRAEAPTDAAYDPFWFRQGDHWHAEVPAWSQELAEREFGRLDHEGSWTCEVWLDADSRHGQDESVYLTFAPADAGAPPVHLWTSVVYVSAVDYDAAAIQRNPQLSPPARPGHDPRRTLRAVPSSLAQQWIRVTWDAEERRVAAWVNGRPAAPAMPGALEAVELARPRVTLGVRPATLPRSAAVVRFELRPGLPQEPPPPPRAELPRWSVALEGSELRRAPSDLDALRQYAADAARPDPARMVGWTALALAEQAVDGRVSRATWDAALRVCDRLLPATPAASTAPRSLEGSQGLDAAATALAVLQATVDADRRAELAPLIERLTAQTARQLAAGSSLGRAGRAGAALDAYRTARLVADSFEPMHWRAPVSRPLAERLAARVHQQDPLLAAALLAHWFGGERGSVLELADRAPVLLRLSPPLGGLVLHAIEEQDPEPASPSAPSRYESLIHYVGRFDLPRALAMIDRMPNGGSRPLTALATRLPADPPDDAVIALVERLFDEPIAPSWPQSYGDAWPFWLLHDRLAGWHAARGRDQRAAVHRRRAELLVGDSFAKDPVARALHEAWLAAGAGRVPDDGLGAGLPTMNGVDPWRYAYLEHAASLARQGHRDGARGMVLAMVETDAFREESLSPELRRLLPQEQNDLHDVLAKGPDPRERDPMRHAYDLLSAVARMAGLGDDPLWRGIDGG